jgi:hypothetical protein
MAERAVESTSTGYVGRTVLRWIEVCVERGRERERECVCESERANFQTHYSSSRPMQYPSWVHSVLHRDMIVSRVSLHTYADHTPFPGPAFDSSVAGAHCLLSPGEDHLPAASFCYIRLDPGRSGYFTEASSLLLLCYALDPFSQPSFPFLSTPADESGPPKSLAKPVTHQNQRAFTEADGGSDAISPCCHGSKAHY